MVSPLTDIGDNVPLPVKPPGEDVTVYPVIESPLDAGALNETLIWPDPLREQLGVVGAFGFVAGIMGVEAADAEESPTRLVATTVKV